MRRQVLMTIFLLVVIVCGISVAPAAEYPIKNKPITVIVPYPAGGATDIGTRMVIEGMKDVLGATFQIVNKTGTSSQVGMTELARSKPDGYTIGASPLPAAIITYLDPDRKAIYTAKSFQPLGNVSFPPVTVAVKADGPFKTIQDLVDASKAKPETLKIASSGAMSNNHLAILQFMKVTGARLAVVQFDGGAAGVNALLGGHVDAWVGVVSEVLPFSKGGNLRVLGVMDKKESKFFPGVKTLEQQGYKVYVWGPTGLTAPAGTPKPIVETLTKAIKKACEDEGFVKKMDELGFPIQYMDSDEYAKFWSELEQQTAPLVKEAKQQK